MTDLNLIDTPPICPPADICEWAKRYKKRNFPDPEPSGVGTSALLSHFFGLVEEEVAGDPWYGTPYDTTVPTTEAELRFRKVCRACKTAVTHGGPYTFRRDSLRYYGDRPIPETHRHYPRQLVSGFLAWLKKNAPDPSNS